jgi:hypothetical protein
MSKCNTSSGVRNSPTDGPLRPGSVRLLRDWSAPLHRDGLQLNAELLRSLREDAARMTQPVNLVDNALRYTPEGATANVSVGRDHPCAVLRVQNFGGGMAPEQLPHLFERVSESTWW